MFRDLELHADDVVMVSGVKAGTSWVQKILHSLLRMDEHGSFGECSLETDVGFNNQIYPDALAKDRPENPHYLFQNACFDDLANQPSPRLFSTHLWREDLLPKSLVDAEHGQGKLVVVLRNPKDVLASLHFFQGEAKDGWFGNEHGPGSFHRFNDESTPNAFGSYYAAVKSLESSVAKLGARALVVYYEDLHMDLSAELNRIASFCGLPLGPKKLDAVLRRVSFQSMKDAGGLSSILTRQGIIGDWRNHLDVEHWSVIDRIVQERLGNSELARKFLAWMTPEPPRKAPAPEPSFVAELPALNAGDRVALPRSDDPSLPWMIGTVVSVNGADVIVNVDDAKADGSLVGTVQVELLGANEGSAWKRAAEDEPVFKVLTLAHPPLP